MNELATQIVLSPPKADVVLVFSASWYVWAGIALFLASLVGVAVAFASKKEEPKQ